MLCSGGFLLFNLHRILIEFAKPNLSLLIFYILDILILEHKNEFAFACCEFTKIIFNQKLVLNVDI